MAMGHFDGDHGRHDFEHFTAKDASTETQTKTLVKILYKLLKIIMSRVVSYTPLVSRSC